VAGEPGRKVLTAWSSKSRGAEAGLTMRQPANQCRSPP
jgi:hypothetical protein